MALASPRLQILLCLLLCCLLGEAVPFKPWTVKPTYEDCSIGERVEEGILNNDGTVPEASGLAYSRRTDGVLWTFNDGGDTRNKIHAISEQGERLQSVTLMEKENIDWEDIAVAVEGGISYIYVADTGNNHEPRYTFNIHKFPEPEILLEDIIIDANDIETIQVSYPGYNGPDDPDENHDCEAMAVDPDTLDILLFTKNWDLDESYVYRVPEGSPGQVREMEYVGLLKHKEVTGADISPAGDTLAIGCYEEGWSYSLPAGQTWVEYIASDPTPCFLQLGIENWREAITVTDTAYWTTSECEREPNSLCELYSYAKDPDTTTTT